MALGAELGTLRVKIEADITSLKNGLNVAKAEFNQYSNDMLGAIQKNQAGLNTLGMTLAGIGAVTIAGFGSAIKTFAGFEEQMKNVQSISQGTKQDFDELSAFALKLGKDTVFSSREAASALYFMASAGYNAKETMQATGAVLSLATATNYDLARSSEFVATTLTSFGLKATDAGRVADVMASVIGKTQATMEKLGYSMPYVASTAHMLGMSIEETAAALGLLYSGGLKGEQAGERLRGALNDLLVPTPKATEAIKALGLTIDQVNPSTHSLVEIVGAFQKTSFTASDAARIFGERAEGMSILVQQGADKLKKLTTELNNSAGAAQKMADIQKEALAKSFEQLAGSVENLKIKIGEGLAPKVKELTHYLEGLVDTLADMPKEQLQLITNLVLLGGAMSAILGPTILFVAQLPNLIAGLGALGGGSLVAGLGALSTVLGGIGLVLATVFLKPSSEQSAIYSLPVAINLLERAFVDARAKGLDPFNMTLGELEKASSVSNVAIKEGYEALGYTYGEGTKVSVLYDDLARKANVLGGTHLSLSTSVKNTTGALTYGYEAGKKSEEGLRELTDALGLTEKATVKTDEITRVFGVTTKEQEKAARAAAAAQAEHTKALEVLTKGAAQTQEALTKLFEDIKAGLGTYKEAWVTNADGILVKTKEFVANQKVVTETGIKEVRIATVKGLEGVKEAHIANGIEIVDANVKMQGLLLTNTQTNTGAIKAIEWESQADQTQTAIEFGNHMLEIKQSNDAKALQLGIDAVKESSAQEKAEKEELAQWIANNQEFLILANRNKYKAEYEDMLQFQAGELGSYKAQTQLLMLEYDSRMQYAKLFGLNEIEIEKWKNEQILQLRIQHGMNYLNMVGNFATDVSNIYIGLAQWTAKSREDDYLDAVENANLKYEQRVFDANQEFADKVALENALAGVTDEATKQEITQNMKLANDLRDLEIEKNRQLLDLKLKKEEDDALIENNALVRFAKWIDNQINLITDLKNAYLDLSSIIGAVGNLIDYMAGTSDTSLTQTVNKVSWLSSLVGKLTGGAGVGGLAEEIGTGGAVSAGASTGGWLAGAGSALKAGAGAVAPFIAPAALLALFGYITYKMVTHDPFAEEDARIKEKAEYDRGIAKQQLERMNANQRIVDANVALGKLTSSYGAYDSTATRIPALTGSGLAGAGTYISSKRIFSADTGKQISGAVLPAYVPPAIQTTTGISGGMDMSSTNSILSELNRYAGQIQSTLWDNLPSIKGNTSKDIVINFAGLMSELQDSNEMLRKNIVNALDFSKMENYLSIIASNTEVSKSSSSFSDSNMDSLADAIMRSYQRRGVLTQARI